MLPHLPPEPREPAAGTAQPSGQRRPGLTPVTLFLVLLLVYVVIKIQIVLVLILMALLFASIIERPVQELDKRRLPRGLGILTVYIAIIGGLVLLSALLAPMITGEANDFRTQAPAQLRQLQDSWRASGHGFLNGPGVHALDRTIDAISNPPAPPQAYAVGLVTGIGGGIVGAITVLVMTFYYLMEKPLLRRLILMEVQPASRSRVNRIWDDVEAQVGRWLRGQLTLCLIIGGASTIAYGIMGIRFWPLLGLVAGITEAIPIVGPWLGGIPAVTIALTQSGEKALLVVGFIVVLQLTENTVLVPRVMRGAVGLSPLTVFIAILAGAKFMNVAGALLAIPIAAAIQVVVSDYLSVRREGFRTRETQMPSWRWMRGHLPTHPSPPPHTDAGVGRPSEITPAGSSTAVAAPTTGWTSHVVAQAAGHGNERRAGAGAEPAPSSVTPATRPDSSKTRH